MRLKLNSLKLTSLELELSDFHIDDIQWRDQTLLAGEQLRLNLSEIQDQIKDLTRNITVTAELARPGESKRIVHVLDTMLPIEKVHDELRTFPGIDVPARLVGTGQTHRTGHVQLSLLTTIRMEPWNVLKRSGCNKTVKGSR